MHHEIEFGSGRLHLACFKQDTDQSRAGLALADVEKKKNVLQERPGALVC
jgi:hypothetical protein